MDFFFSFLTLLMGAVKHSQSTRGVFQSIHKSLRYNKIALIAGGCFFNAFLTSCKKPPPPSPPPLQVAVLTIKTQAVPLTHTWVGTLTGNINAQIRAQVTGYLQTQVYQDGAIVKQGDVLFQIDPRPFQAALDQAKGNLAQAQAQLTKDQLNADRATQLYAKQVISQEEYDTLTQAYHSSYAMVQSAKGAVEAAQLNLNFTTIISPINGIASIATAQVGDLLSPSSGVLATVTTVDPIRVDFSVAEQEYIAYIKPFFKKPSQSPVGKPHNEAAQRTRLYLTLADGSIYPYSGSILAVNNTVTVGTGTLSFEGLFKNPGNLLRPGQFGLITAVTSVVQEGILIPQRAVMDLQGTSQVAVVDAQQKIHFVTLQLGPSIGSDWLVEKGLKAGDQVVIEGIQKVKEGMVVQMTPYVETLQEKKAGLTLPDFSTISPSIFQNSDLQDSGKLPGTPNPTPNP